MIEVLSPGFLTLVVDKGRYGYGHIGVPASPELDRYAATLVRSLVGNPDGSAVLEVMGDLRLRFSEEMTCAITGAKVDAVVDGRPCRPWSAFHVKKGSEFHVREVLEGLRYYVAFSGTMAIEPLMGSFTTNLECAFGGFHGRPLMKGDMIGLRDAYSPVDIGQVPDRMVPSLKEPHLIRLMAGPEAGHFTPSSIAFLENRREAAVFKATSRLNRTGIRLDGDPFLFRDDVEPGIISEGILPGTVQVPADGQPIINLGERTIGGYARLATVADVDLDRLAQVKPGDRVVFTSIDMADAERLWRARRDAVSFFCRKQ